MGKSRILVVGATGEMGKYIVHASVKLGHPTFVLVRPGSSNPAKQALLAEFQSLGATSLHVSRRSSSSPSWMSLQCGSSLR